MGHLCKLYANLQPFLLCFSFTPLWIINDILVIVGGSLSIHRWQMLFINVGAAIVNESWVVGDLKVGRQMKNSVLFGRWKYRLWWNRQCLLSNRATEEEDLFIKRGKPACNAMQIARLDGSCFRDLTIRHMVIKKKLAGENDHRPNNHRPHITLNASSLWWCMLYNGWK